MAGSRKKRRASSDMDESDEEEDRMERLMSSHQQRNVSNWGQGEDASGGRSLASRLARRDERRDMQRKRRRDEEFPDQDESFQMDTVGTGVQRIQSMKGAPPASTSSLSVQRVDGLLLPEHVDIQTEEEIAAQHNEELDESGLPIIEQDEDEAAQGELGSFIRMDGDRSQAARYYEIEEEQQRKAFEECPTCGEKGHDKKSCPHLQCLACGALDEHSTRECPMSVSCFRCGGQGHKSFECKKPRTQGGSGWKECQRCGSTAHVDPKCPTLWRIYYYNTEEDYDRERLKKYREREDAEVKGGRDGGGFDYRSESDGEEEGELIINIQPPSSWDPVVRWCYNCAAKGNHWGDDCPLPRCNPTRQSGDPSGFSEYMAASGPYAHSLPPPPRPDQHAYRTGPGRGYEDYDRFEAGPGASMHVYDPQREAMHNVDQLFDRYGPGASRRRDAIRRGRGDPASRSAAPSRVDRRSGEGSKAQRYQVMAQERERDRWSSADYHRRDGRSSQVSSSGIGPAIAIKTTSNQTPSETSLLDDEDEFELTHFVAASKGKVEPLKNAGKKERSAAKLKKIQEKKIAAALKMKRKLGLPEQATKAEVKAASAVRKEEAKIAKRKAKAAKRASDPSKIAVREQMRVAFEEAQARRLSAGKVEEHSRKAREFAVQEEKWLTGD